MYTIQIGGKECCILTTVGEVEQLAPCARLILLRFLARGRHILIERVCQNADRRVLAGEETVDHTAAGMGRATHAAPQRLGAIRFDPEDLAEL